MRAFPFFYFFALFLSHFSFAQEKSRGKRIANEICAFAANISLIKFRNCAFAATRAGYLKDVRPRSRRMGVEDPSERSPWRWSDCSRRSIVIGLRRSLVLSFPDRESKDRRVGTPLPNPAATLRPFRHPRFNFTASAWTVILTRLILASPRSLVRTRPKG